MPCKYFFPGYRYASNTCRWTATESLGVECSPTAQEKPSVEIRPQVSRDAPSEDTPVLVETKEELAGARFATLRLLRPWFPEADPEHERAQTFRAWHSKRDVVMHTCSVASVVIFLLNLSCTIVIKAK